MKWHWQPHPRMAIVRLIRGVWPDGNPLRRRLELAETTVVACLLAGFLIGAPITALTAAHLTIAAGQHDEHMARYRVHAVLLENSPVFYTPYGRVAMASLARWTAPDGAVRSGLVTTGRADLAGATVTIWTSDSGWPVGPPLGEGKVMAQAVSAGLAAPVILGGALLGLWALAQAAINRRRLAAWGDAWRVVEPRWTSHA
jgi:hypothetical protein